MRIIDQDKWQPSRFRSVEVAGSTIATSGPPVASTRDVDVIAAAHPSVGYFVAGLTVSPAWVDLSPSQKL